jgi:predicted CoA-binding protein
MLELEAIEDFLAQHRLAVVGVSTRDNHMGNALYREFVKRGYDVVPVSTSAAAIDGTACVRDLSSLPEPVDGAIVVVNADAAFDVVRQAAAAGITRVWLFKGLGGKSAHSEEAEAICLDNHMSVVAGACPLMFLEPAGGMHRVHRFFRRINGSLPKAA